MAEEQKFLQLPALGLPFALGTLYNANKNQIVPGISLCEYKDANERSANVDVRRNITYKTDITTKDSLESKMRSLGISGNLAISALANKVEVKGSGEYFSDTKTSKTQARVVLEASGTTKDEFLQMNCFFKEKVDQELIRRIGATHVVVGITYGFQFFLKLETSCESEEEKVNVEGCIQLKVAYLPVEGSIKGSYDTKEEKKVNELQVKIHGTVQIKTNPTTFQDAMEIYKTIPELAKDKDCPMTVYLLPLASIYPSVPKVCGQVKESLLSSVTATFEDIANSEVALSGIQTSGIATREPRIRRKAKQLAALLKGHKIWLQMKLHDIMSDPKMEKDSSESEQIRAVLKKHENSPFSIKTLGSYISRMEKEVRFMENLVRMLTVSHENGSSVDDTSKKEGEARKNKTTIDIRSDDIDLVIPFERSNVFVLELPIITEEEDLLKEMQNYDPDKGESSARWIAESLTLPFEDENIQRKVLKYAKVLAHLAGSNKNDDEEHTTQFRCVFKVYIMEGQPTIYKYDDLKGDNEAIDIGNYIDTEMK